MIFEPKIIFQTYLKNYHWTKAKYIKSMLDNLSKSESEIFGNYFNKDDSNEFRLTLKSDLRQTYFHAIETFFELLFALNPKGKKVLDDQSLLISLTYSKGTETYAKIKDITSNENALDFLEEIIDFNGFKISIGHYLFYICILPNNKIPSLVFNDIKISLDSIKYGIKILSKDFIDREEYNAYKHGLKIIPSVSHIYLINADTMKNELDFDLSDSMSFYLKSKNVNETKIVTKIYDSERDFQMISFCSNLIHNLMFYRRIYLKLPGDENKFKEIPIILFAKDKIDECNKINIKISEIKFTSLEAILVSEDPNCQ